MIVWLASYPRSGNTLLRQILLQVFGQTTYSRYNDPLDIGANAHLAAAVGHVAYGGDWDAFYDSATRSREPVFVKTHDPPQDDAPAVCIVRDGRAAAVSWLYKMQAETPRPRHSLDDIIEGRVRFGSWSGHLDAWSIAERPRTLCLQFEALTLDPQPSIARLSRFLGRPQVASFANRRQELQAIAPGFIREGSNAKNIAELNLAQRSRFRELHGRWLDRLGYAS